MTPPTIPSRLRAIADEAEADEKPMLRIVGAAMISGTIHLYADADEFRDLIASREWGIAGWVDKTVVHPKRDEPAPSPDLAACRAALVRLAQEATYEAIGGFYCGLNTGDFGTSREAIQAICARLGFTVSPAEIDGILSGATT